MNVVSTFSKINWLHGCKDFNLSLLWKAARTSCSFWKTGPCDQGRLERRLYTTQLGYCNKHSIDIFSAQMHYKVLDKTIQNSILTSLTTGNPPLICYEYSNHLKLQWNPPPPQRKGIYDLVLMAATPENVITFWVLGCYLQHPMVMWLPRAPEKSD